MKQSEIDTMRNRMRLASITVLIVTICALFGAVPAYADTSQAMYRLYNPNSGEHFYTASADERNHLVSVGWNYEGIGWHAPQDGADVFRLYNPNAGDHHYTTSSTERDHLVSVGWSYEGVGWHSADDEVGVPLYRQYNPNAISGAHNYTTSKAENDYLVSVGWNAEGIGWYGEMDKGPAAEPVDNTPYGSVMLLTDDGWVSVPWNDLSDEEKEYYKLKLSLIKGAGLM